MHPSSSLLGLGPGSRLLQALADHWGVRVLDKPRPASGHLFLPPWWHVLRRAGALPPCGPWKAQWEMAAPAGPWAPNALALMTHRQGGCVAVDLDPNDDGTQAAWWLGKDTVCLLATSLEELAERLAQGPQALEAQVQEDGEGMAPASAWQGPLPLDPLTRQWEGGWTEPMEVRALERAGQGVRVGPGWTRHPARLLFAHPQAPGT